MGGDPERFWHITPREAARELTALRKRRTHDHNELMAAAWHAAALPRLKRFPKLKDLLIDDAGPKAPQQSREEVEANLKFWLRPKPKDE